MKNIFITILYFSPNLSSAEPDFDQWKKNFKIYALEKGISQGTLNKAIDNTKFLPDVIKYDRYQPEFYEDTYTYINKRTNKDKVKKGIFLYKKERTRIPTRGWH